ncbi:MAG: hypothetical protein AUG49_19325 [Catenulispora sp. 13_1_20CM_3_70_7]|nr:MAG: hypothetical protein AUG49_19325 [Catenulispora sp. 13_1_20CM_3_70_7]
MTAPTIGRIVHYKLTPHDAEAINRRRADANAFRRNHSGTVESGQPGASGHQEHVGNHAQVGDVYPAVVVRVFDPSVTTANLQVQLDGNDTYWATSRMEGDEPGFWSWPPRA